MAIVVGHVITIYGVTIILFHSLQYC